MLCVEIILFQATMQELGKNAQTDALENTSTCGS